MKTREINLNFPLTDLDGEQIGIAGKVIGQHLAIGNDGEPIKVWGWCTALNKGETIKLDQPDYKKLKELVEQCKTISILTKGQVLSYLEDVPYDKE